MEHVSTPTSEGLLQANKQLIGARVRLAQAQQTEALALLSIKKFEGRPDWQGTEDRNYVATRLSQYAARSEISISAAKSNVRKIKKEMRQVK